MNSVAMRILAALILAAPLAGCGGGAGAPPPLEGAAIGGPFALTGTDGQTVRDSDFAGKYRIVYFGYTFCPDVCPNDMARIGKLMRGLDQSDPALSTKIVPIFISVDPERDTPAVVKQFVSAFHPRFVGLTGSPQAVAAAAKEYAVSYTKQAPSTPGAGYLVDHLAIAYLMGPKGEPIALLSRDMSVEAMTAEVKKWVR